MKDKTIEITTCETGVTIWIKERYKLPNGKSKVISHWILDASTIKADGTLHLELGDNGAWRKNLKQNEFDKELFELTIKKP